MRVCVKNIRMDPIYSVLKCALSEINDKHISKHPVELSCGHYVCETCLNEQYDIKSILCRICKSPNTRDLTQNIDSKSFNCVLNANLNALFEKISNEFNNKLDAYKRVVAESQESFENTIESIRSGIDVKIESIKKEFDNIRDSMYDSLDKLKDKSKILFEKNTREAYGEKIKRFKAAQKDWESKPIDSNKLYFYQDEIKRLNEYIDEYRKYSPVVKFNQSKRKINVKEFVGEIIYSETYWTFPEASRRVSLKALINGKYLRAENFFIKKSLFSKINWESVWKHFELIGNSDGTVSLKSMANNKYICAENSGKSPLIANRDVIKEWERFTLHKQSDGSYSFKAKVNSKYVTIEGVGNNQLIAKSYLAGVNESFKIIELLDN